MNMPEALWRKLIRETLERISDEDYQRRSWFGRGNEFSSPDELVNQLYDDYQFEDFLKWYNISASEIQRRSADAFEKVMKIFVNQTPEHLDPYKVISDPLWCSVRENAKILLSVF